MKKKRVIKEKRDNISLNMNPKALSFGLTLMLLGILAFLLQTDIFILRNWWVVFILAPGVVLLYISFADYRNTKRISFKSSVFFLIGSVLNAVSVILLFELAWKVFWPLIILFPGIGLIAGAFYLNKFYKHENRFQFLKIWFFAIGGVTIIIALFMILSYTKIFILRDYFPRWWGIMIIFISLGGVVNIIRFFIKKIRRFSYLLVHVLLTLFFLLTGLFIYFKIPWGYLAASLLFASGFFIFFFQILWGGYDNDPGTD